MKISTRNRRKKKGEFTARVSVEVSDYIIISWVITIIKPP